MVGLIALNNEEETIQSLSWKTDGTSLATTSKDKKVRLWDPRGNKVSQMADSHTGNRESIVTWLGSSHRILTSGFDLVMNATSTLGLFNLTLSFLITEPPASSLCKRCSQVQRSGILSSL